MRKLALFIAAVSSMGLSAAEPQLKNTGLYYRLFAPLTFYHNVASSQFNIISNDSDEVSQAIDQALMHVYLKRPELVKVTESEQEEAGSLRQDIIETPVMQEVEMVEQAAPMPETPEAAPVEVVIEKPNFWKYKGDANLQFMQNYVSDNWYKGGESNQAAVGSVTLEANYDNKSKWKWDNKLEMKLGFQTSPSDTVHKFKTNEDLIRYTGKVGLQAANRWYYTLQMLAYTQFYHGLKSNNTKVFSDFMSPFNLSVGLGMDYKVQALANKLTGTINMSPLAVNYRYVDRADLAASFGVKTPDHSHSLTDFGSQITASLTWQVNDVLSWKTRIYGFSSYHRSEVEWENTFTLRVSKYISANLFLFPRFDDANNRDENLGYWQFKEYSSLGFSYNF
ncbi:DUF3078 domain-containing protein [Prevotella communis]|jgi:hypothetical protein|uniref:DUF3078 domain-containing protein n=1 Tax=Prevotella communis TaxID=2913614 RepID=UPI001EDBFD59|nr:DUF3078 domain-containing protein [Prevotella communis]UKK57780.1 DUF3078 domain-containing protein [Prevotella communis]UKK60472.1 DUF3078 domain-containing protein [Prevotella communis]UKK63195.1 DUF3078 domain-containing protein [Prevotella communis]UKK66020.1 DUF3078 domain-containing protein [Prevotella communis]UKK68450.1 DUF3078 domain-containing protein [Prevotella communis]